MSEKSVGPSGWYYVLAVLVFVGGCVAFAFILFNGLSDISSGLTRVVVPGSEEILLKHAGEHTIYHEYQSVVDGEIYSMERGGISGLRLSLKSAETGREIPLLTSSMSSSYSMGSRSGVSLFVFTIDSPGKYVFSSQYPPGRQGPKCVMAIGHGFMKQLMTTIFGGLGVMLGSIGAAIAIAVTTGVKRSNARRRLEAEANPPEVPVWTDTNTLPPPLLPQG